MDLQIERLSITSGVRSFFGKKEKKDKDGGGGVEPAAKKRKKEANGVDLRVGLGRRRGGRR